MGDFTDCKFEKNWPYLPHEMAALLMAFLIIKNTWFWKHNAFFTKKVLYF